MKQFLANTKMAVLVWKLALVRAALFSAVTLGTAWQTSTASVDFGAMHKWERVTLFVGIFVLWGNQMLSFLDKTTARIANGQSPAETGGTDFLKRQPENG